jgi:hypothetical protein
MVESPTCAAIHFTIAMQDIYTYTIPSFIKGLSGLKTIIEKTKTHLAEKGIEESVFIEERLIDDMFPFKRQVQVATDQAKGLVARLTAIEAPVFEDTETNLDELMARLDRAIEFLKSVPEDAFLTSSEHQVVLPYFPDKFIKGFDYAREYVIPNFYFHIVMAYAIARKEGVQLQKQDYINGLPLQDI